MLKYDLMVDDEDAAIIIANLAAIQKAAIFNPVNYSKGEISQIPEQQSSRDKKRLEKECKKLNRPGGCAKCCGAPTTANKNAPA